MISVTMVAKVREETILETALVSLLPDFEVEVGASLIFTLLFTLCPTGDRGDQQRGEGRPQGGCPVQGPAAASEGFHIFTFPYCTVKIIDREGGDNQRGAAHWMEPRRLKPVGRCPGSPILANLKYFPPISCYAHVMLAQVALLVNLLGLAMKLTGLKPVDSVAQVANLHVLPLCCLCQEPFCTGAWREGGELQQGGGGSLPGDLRQRHGRDGRGLEGGRDQPPGEEEDARRPQHHHPELLSHSPTKVVILTHFQLGR